MASVFIGSNNPNSGFLAVIDYSLNGHIREFKYKGKVLFSEADNVRMAGWKTKLKSIIKKQGLDIDNGCGLHAFIRPLFKKGIC